ncbi:MAG TPA: hypothetical protein DC017_13880 [Candidatus Wallbacteria bacterium]|nr:hypothetical protein [Candidatus Wallbacteria bacterium]
MTLFSYILTHDTGFAPNPFGGYCTLACCKPIIRLSAKKGDWIIGLSGKQSGNSLIYAMKITETPLTYKEYFSDIRFKSKIPDFKANLTICKRGDNIYKPAGNGFKQLKSLHSNIIDGTENTENKTRDLKGKYVLVSDEFYYFGCSHKLPDDLKFLITGRGHKSKFTAKQISDFISHIQKQPRGISGKPTIWPRNDNSWREKKTDKIKIILSRKGFDSKAGGYPSPILKNGKLLSLTIPARDSIKYSDLTACDGLSYFDIMRQLNSKIKLNDKSKILTKDIECHLDPDLTYSTYPRKTGWKPVFGQIGAAQSHLSKNNVKLNDLFLFFGLFQKTKTINGKISFDRASQPIHMLFGYMQIGKIIALNKDADIPNWLKYHPHARDNRIILKNNTIYIAKDKLSFNPNIPGAGIFKFNESLVLTKKNMKTSQWELPDIFRDVNITYHGNKSDYGWNEDYFQSAMRGQEFIIDENDEITDWAVKLIESNS